MTQDSSHHITPDSATLALFFYAILFAASLFSWSVEASPDLPPGKNGHSHSSFPGNLPFWIESGTLNGEIHGTIHSALPRPISQVSREFRNPATWCDTLILHLNVKTCTYQDYGNVVYLTVYVGRKFYQKPENVFQIHYQFRVVEASANRLRVLLTAALGPMGTTDYRILLYATDGGTGRTDLHFEYSYRFGWSARMAMETYLDTIGRDKVGFTLVPDATPAANGRSGTNGKAGTENRKGSDKPPRMVPVQGLRGAVERNVMRYYLALLAYFEKDDFESRIRTWYDLNEIYPRQLHELSREAYLQSKRIEWRNQTVLQRDINLRINRARSERGSKGTNRASAHGALP